jgi:anthranilate phosphoribosyltransferase
VLEKFTKQLAAGQELTHEEIVASVEELTDANINADTKADFLTQLARKGETVEEIADFARAMLAKAILPELNVRTRAQEILDVVGTGGDRLGTFNISTTTAIICASAGLIVAKHGNRAATSRCGSADVLEVLGIPIGLSPEAAAVSLGERGFAFFFAPNYHPAFRHVAAARKLCAERGQRTIFNYLGPLLNPARPSAMLVGVPRPELCEPVAHVLQSLGVRRAMVVCGAVGCQPEGHVPTAVENPAFLDELSTLGENTIAEFYHENGFNASILRLEEFPLQPATLENLLGSDRESCARIVRHILAGEERGPKRDAVLLNTAAALMVAGIARTVASGWELAAELIDSGRASEKLRELTAA